MGLCMLAIFIIILLWEQKSWDFEGILDRIGKALYAICRS